MGRPITLLPEIALMSAVCEVEDANQPAGDTETRPAAAPSSAHRETYDPFNDDKPSPWSFSSAEPAAIPLSRSSEESSLSLSAGIDEDISAVNGVQDGPARLSRSARWFVD